MKKMLFIVNPKAGRTTLKNCLIDVIDIFCKKDYEVRIYLTQGVGDAARDALSGWDPTGGCIYYYNPKKTSNQFMMSRPVQKVIGDHYFCT